MAHYLVCQFRDPPILWGYRNYETPGDGRNNTIIALITGGEGWHNNHHADPASARHGHYWWEFDFAWQMIRLLMWFGLATNVSLPSPKLGENYRARPRKDTIPPIMGKAMRWITSDPKSPEVDANGIRRRLL